MVTNPKECKCPWNTVEYVTYSDKNLFLEHYYECWECGKVLQHNDKKHPTHFLLDAMEQEYLTE